jgi:hypothetical protein
MIIYVTKTNWYKFYSRGHSECEIWFDKPLSVREHFTSDYDKEKDSVDGLKFESDHRGIFQTLFYLYRFHERRTDRHASMTLKAFKKSLSPKEKEVVIKHIAILINNTYSVPDIGNGDWLGEIARLAEEKEAEYSTIDPHPGYDNDLNYYSWIDRRAEYVHSFLEEPGCYYKDWVGEVDLTKLLKSIPNE